MSSQESSDKQNDENAIEMKKVEEKPPVPKRDYQDKGAEDSNMENYSKTDIGKRKKIGSFPRPEVIYQPENLESSMTCLKCSLVVFNLIIWILGAIVTGLAIWIEVDKDFFKIQTGVDIKQISSAGYILIIVGITIMVIGFIGCYGAAKEKIVMLIIYAVIVVIIILMELAVIGVVWSATAKESVKEEIKLRIKKATSDQITNDAKRYFMDLIQTKLHCCGIYNYTDYKESNQNIPYSCMNVDTGETFDKGCFDAILKYLHDKAVILGSVAIVIFLLQLGSLVFTICLYCGLKQSSKSIF